MQQISAAGGCATARGEVFFIAVGEIDERQRLSHRVDGLRHGTAVSVRGVASRQGIGSALFKFAEADALASGADSIYIDASLAAVEFYKAVGFEDRPAAKRSRWRALR